MTGNLTITLVQPKLEWRSPEENRGHLERMVRDAPRSDVYVLPETFTTGFQGAAPAPGEPMDGDTVGWMRALADDTGGAIGGSAIIADDAGLRNRFLWVQPGGRVDHYDKRHMFAYAGEHERYVAGRKRVIVDNDGWRVCPLVCYDLRFPVWCRYRGDYDLLVFVANWPDTRIAAWDALLRARAIENQCYVAGVNRVGEDGNGLRYNGHSGLYDPMGEAVVPPWDGEGARTATLSLNTVTQTRRNLPFAAEADAFTIELD